MTRDPRDARIQKLEERQQDMIHKAELRELIEEWRESAKNIDPFACRSVKRNCADELEALLNDA